MLDAITALRAAQRGRAHRDSGVDALTPRVRAELRLRDNGARVRVEVEDDGCGIPASHLEGVFEKFGQVQTGAARTGTGLGLAFCKLAVEAHGGGFGVTSDLGRGSSFWFELPLEPRDGAVS